MNIEIINAIIAAVTSIIVVILSHILLSQNDKRQILEKNREQCRNNYINPIRFMLAENYYRMNEILERVIENRQKEDEENIHTDKEGKNQNIFSINDASEVRYKNEDWFVNEGCYLMSSCYLTACLFAYMENLRNGIPFFKTSQKQDTRLISLVNKLVVDFSANLNIYYVIQMNIGKECYLQSEHRVLTYREFCQCIMCEENFIWYESLINYFKRIGDGEYRMAQSLLIHMEELAKYLDKIVSGGDSIKQKIVAEKESKDKLYG